MKKIGVFAGVFDPIHIGHTEFIKQAVQDKKLDKVYLLVEKKPKYKNCIASYRHRRKMAELATADIPQVQIFEQAADTFPITSTMPRIRDENPSAKLFLLLGDDVAAHINEWQDRDALKDVEMIVANRNREERYSKISSLKIRNQLKKSGQMPALHPDVLKYCQDKKLY